MRNARVVFAALAALAALPYATASAQAWPAKPVKVIVPYAAGGVVDVQTRVVSAWMAADLGQPFVVEARPGANGNIAAEAAARAPSGGSARCGSSGNDRRLARRAVPPALGRRC